MSSWWNVCQRNVCQRIVRRRNVCRQNVLVPITTRAGALQVFLRGASGHARGSGFSATFCRLASLGLSVRRAAFGRTDFRCGWTAKRASSHHEVWSIEKSSLFIPFNVAVARNPANCCVGVRREGEVIVNRIDDGFVGFWIIAFEQGDSSLTVSEYGDWTFIFEEIWSLVDSE